MKKLWIILGVIGIITIIGFFAFPKIIDKVMKGGPSDESRQNMECSVQPGEWVPDKEECPGTTPEIQAKCNEFCDKHPDCCQGKGEERSNDLALPGLEEISALSRNYPEIIKCVNEGPAIYPQGQFKVISDETLNKMKDTGFNTVQVLTINDCTGEKCVMDESSKSLLLNDIIAIKKKGFAVWLAVEYINAPPGSNLKLPEYLSFRESFIEYCREIGELAEEYKVEYVTVNNEPDLFLQEQTQWGSEEQINEYVAEIMPLANSAVREKFRGKVINKVTQTKKRPKEVLDASFINVDIAAVDVGPPIDANFMGMEPYKKEFEEYQYYASLAQKAGVEWMVGEYWQYNYFETPSGTVKNSQLSLADASFDAYLKALPSGAGYAWNDFSSFTLPKGEETRQALKEFFNKI